MCGKMIYWVVNPLYAEPESIRWDILNVKTSEVGVILHPGVSMLTGEVWLSCLYLFLEGLAVMAIIQEKSRMLGGKAGTDDSITKIGKKH